MVLGKLPRLDPRTEQAIASAGMAVWQAIGCDAFEDMKPGATLSRGEVLELVMDADRLVDMLKRSGASEVAQQAAADYSPAGSARTREILVRLGFRFARYGL